MFQYPNQNDVLHRHTENIEMMDKINKTIKFTTYNRKGFPNGEKVGKIIDVRYPYYIVKVGKKNFLISKDDYISIF